MKVDRVWSHAYGEVVSVYIQDYFADTNAAVLFDIGSFIGYIDVNDRHQAIKDLGLEELSYKELETSDFVILEFNRVEDMEEYLFKVEDSGLYIKFYKQGVLYEEIEPYYND